MEATSDPGRGRSASGEDLQNRARGMAGEVKRVAAEEASGVKEEVRERAHEVKEEVRERAHEVKEEVRERVEARRHVATEKAHALARALRAAGDKLEDDGENTLARYGRQAADQVERFASYLDGNDTGGMMRQLETMARDNPAAFTGSTFAAGILLGRFLRASNPEDTRAARTYEERGASFTGDGAADTSRTYEPDISRGYETGFGGMTGPGSSAEIHRAAPRTDDDAAREYRAEGGPSHG